MRRWWKALSRTQQLTVAGLAVTLVIGLVGALPAYVDLARRPTSTTAETAPLGVSAFEVKRVDEIEAELLDADEGTTPDRIKGPFIDVTVRNVGTSTTVVTGAEFRVTVAEIIESCKPQGGPLRISGRYTATLPNPLPNAPFSIRHSIRHEIRPDTADRFAFSLGPKVWSVEAPSLLLYQVDVLLQHDAPSTGPVVAGTALLSFPIYYGSRYGQGQYREFFQAIPASDELNRSVHYNDCIARNRAKTSRFLSLSGSRSPTLAAIGADLRR
jgi:hypothetical protein